jgi:hypothetical protein
MSRIKFLLVLLALTAQVPLASATVTYAVGTCKPSLISFPTIQGALNGNPPPNVVEICPGTYPEQILILGAVTLEGISDGTSTGATISVPAGGLVSNTGNDLGDAMAVQVQIVNTAGTGEINLSNLTVDGTGNNVLGALVVGVFYHDATGTMDHLTIQNQNGHSNGVGVWVEGDGEGKDSNPSVTVENSSVQNFDSAGIVVESGTNSGQTIFLNATIEGNYITSGPTVGNCMENPPCVAGISLIGPVSASVSSNLITGAEEGVVIDSQLPYTVGSVSRNTFVGDQYAIWIQDDLVPVTSNTIFNVNGASIFGIWAQSAVSPITGNTIIGGVNAGISLNCHAGYLASNTILGAAFGLEGAPPGIAPTDKYYNVSVISSGC